jgi:hypothetical protein
MEITVDREVLREVLDRIGWASSPLARWIAALECEMNDYSNVVLRASIQEWAPTDGPSDLATVNQPPNLSPVDPWSLSTE